MAYTPVARDLQTTTGMSIRLARRDSFDAIKAIQPPSATGGAPKLPGSDSGVPGVTKVDNPMPPLPGTGPDALPDRRRGATPALDDFWRMRKQRAQAENDILPAILRSDKRMEDYSVLNQGFVDEMATAFESYAAQSDDWAARVQAAGGAASLAQRAVAQVQRAFELESSGLSLPDQINLTRNGREVKRIMETIRAQRALR